MLTTPKQNGQDHNDNINTITTGDDRTRLQALSLINDCYKYIMDLTTNGVVITDAIKFVQTNKEKLMSHERRNGKESKESDYDEDKDQLEEKQEEANLEKKKQQIRFFKPVPTAGIFTCAVITGTD